MALFWIVLAVIGGTVLLLTMTHDSGMTLGMQSDQFASAIYLTLWAAVIAVGFLGSRSRIRHSLRDLAYWMLLAVVLMTGYQYRYELQDVASRLTAGVVPGSPMSYSVEGRAAVMIDRSANGHFEARVLMNDVPVRTVVDTGASLTVLTFEDAERVGLDVERLAFDTPVMTANGRANAARGSVDTFVLGDIERRNVPVMVTEAGRLGQSLLGMQFLGSLSSFEMRGSRLILAD